MIAPQSAQRLSALREQSPRQAELPVLFGAQGALTGFSARNRVRQGRCPLFPKMHSPRER